MSEIELQDAILRHSLQILRLSAGEQAAVEEILRELERELKALLESRALSGATKTQLRALIADARTAIDSRYAIVAQSVDTHALALIIAEKTVAALEDVIPATVAMPSAETLASLTQDVLIDGAPSSAWWDKQAEDTAFKFAAQVRQGVINGETQERIVQRIVGRRGEPGLMEVSRRNARSLIHSSVMSAANQARLATFRKNGRLIKGLRWLATLDGHTCARCAALDGNAWDLDGKPIMGTKLPFMAPPIHFGDRCVLSPIPKTFKDIGLDIPEPDDAGRRASSLGPVHGKTTFDDYFRRLSAAQQDAQFGKGRAALFRAGKITIRDLVSGTGRELSLEELRVS
jgi:SPP1 gp7 family putative phage head morphogenesis protein